MLPLIILCGSAGSGKDTVADFLVNDAGCVAIAQADPIKRLAQMVFGFTEEQLWKSRQLKEAVDPRFNTLEAWDQGNENLDSTRQWLRDVLGPNPEHQVDEGIEALQDWYDNLLEQYYGKLSPRIMLQTLGTEWGRKFSASMWSDLAIRTAVDLLSTPRLAYGRMVGTYLNGAASATPNFVVISDGRFQNEIINVKRAGGMAIRVDNPDLQVPSTVGISGHASETEQFGIPAHFFDIILTNDKKAGLEALRQKVSTLAAELRHVTVIP